MTDRPRSGWDSSFADFRAAPPQQIRERLAEFITDASPEQHRAWTDSIPPLQTEVSQVLIRDELARHYSAILEYELPMESRRPDVVLLVGAGVHVTGPDELDDRVEARTRTQREPVLTRDALLSDGAYCPLPTIVEAARELMEKGTLRTLNRAHAATQPAVDEISRIIHQAALTKSRHLILLTGVPGAGKTLVGLQTVHARYLDDLAVSRADGKATAPAVYLSGNGPLVEVLQYEMRCWPERGRTSTVCATRRMHVLSLGIIRRSAVRANAAAWRRRDFRPCTDRRSRLTRTRSRVWAKRSRLAWNADAPCGSRPRPAPTCKWSSRADRPR